MTIWLTILGMAIVTFATRFTGIVALRGELAPWLRRWLSFVPVAVFTALILPDLLLQSGPQGRALMLGPALPAGLVGAVVAWHGGNILLTIGAGMLTFWALRWAGF